MARNRFGYREARDFLKQMGMTLTPADHDQWKVAFKGNGGAAEYAATLREAVEAGRQMRLVQWSHVSRVVARARQVD